MLTIKEEIFKMKLKDRLYETGLDETINFLFDSEVVDNFNLALGFFGFLLDEINLEWSNEIQTIIINIMSKKNNIDDLSKYSNLSVAAIHILNKWKEEKEELVNLLIEYVKDHKKNK